MWMAPKDIFSCKCQKIKAKRNEISMKQIGIYFDGSQKIAFSIIVQHFRFHNYVLFFNWEYQFQFPHFQHLICFFHQLLLVIQ